MSVKTPGVKTHIRLLSGGAGTIPGVVIGVAILQVINYSRSFLGVNHYLTYIIKGLIIILAVSIDMRKYAAKK